MVRVLLALSIVAMAVASLGCRMCASPFDYCGPTFTGQCGETCDRDYRAGSVLSGSEVYFSDDQELVATPKGMAGVSSTSNGQPLIQRSSEIREVVRIDDHSPRVVAREPEHAYYAR